jgi:hypothetical protein
MKKFFSILCALAIVFSANAAQLSKKDILAGNAAKKEIRSQHVSNAKVSTFKSFTTTTATVAKVAPQTKHGIEGKAVAGVEKKVVKNLPTNALKAKKAAIDLSFTSADADIEWQDHCADAGWWQIQAETDEYYVTLSNLSSNEAAGEYAWEDLDPAYCGIWYEEAGDNILAFTDGSCTVTVSEEAVLVVGTFTAEDGNTYNISITYEATVYPEGGEFECDEVTFSYYSSDGDAWYKLVVAEPEMTFRFDVIVGEGLEDVKLDSTYTLDDMIAKYTYVYLGEDQLTFTEVSFLKSSNEDGSADLNVVATDENGNVWKLHYAFPAAPEAEKFETITADVTMTKEAFWYWYNYTFEAADEANAIVLQIMPDDSFYGTWEAGKDITGAVTPLNGVESEIYSGEVTIEQNAEGFKITGKVLCWNSTEYTLDLTYTIPDATRQAELTLENLELSVFEGAWQLDGFSEDGKTYASIAAYADEVSGTYTESELAADYCYIYTDLVLDEEGHVVEGSKFELLKANLEVTFNEADSTILINGTFRGQNGEDIPEFTLALSGRIPTLEVSDMTFEFADEEEGIRVTPSNDDDAWDWYVVDEATFEYNGADYIAEVIYGKYGNTYAVTGEQLLSFEEDLANYLTASGTYYLVVWGAGEREMTTEAFVHEFEFEGGLPEGCTQYDAEEGNDFIVNFAEFAIDDQYVAEHGIYIIGATDAQSNYVSLQIFAPEGLALGEYSVLDNSEEPFVVSGELDLTEGNIYGSFAGKLNASGQITVPLWLLVDGTVTITEHSVIVDATNCAGAKIQCKMGAAQGIDNVDADKVATKSIKNGQLIIRKNGVDYNAQGAIVK